MKKYPTTTHLIFRVYVHEEGAHDDYHLCSPPPHLAIALTTDFPSFEEALRALTALTIGPKDWEPETREFLIIPVVIQTRQD